MARYFLIMLLALTPLGFAGNASAQQAYRSTPSATPALATALVVKASGGTLYTFQVSADSTLSGAAWWVMILNSTTDPGNGAVVPIKCFAASSGTPALGGTFASGGIYFPKGITIVVSTTGCFTETQSAHAFIAADWQ